MAVEGDEGADRHVERFDTLAAAEIGEINDKAGGYDFRTDALEEFDGCLGCAARGDEIVDQDDALTRFDGILVHFHLVEAVFERIGDGNGFVGQFSLFPDRYEAGG